jgi:hypothetical protein
VSDSVRRRQSHTSATPDVASTVNTARGDAPAETSHAPLDFLRRAGDGVTGMKVALRAGPDEAAQIAESAERLVIGARPTVAVFVGAAEREQSALLGWFRLFEEDLEIELRLDGQDPDAEPVSASLRADGQVETRLREFLRAAKAVAATQGDDVVVDVRLTARKAHALAAARELLATRQEYAGTAEMRERTQVTVYYQTAAWDASVALRSVAGWEQQGWFQEGGRALVIVCDSAGRLAGMALDIVGARSETTPDWLAFSRAAWREFQAREERTRRLRAEESSWPAAPTAVTFDTLRVQERAPGLAETARRLAGLRETLAVAYLASTVVAETDGRLTLRFAGTRPATCALDSGPPWEEIGANGELARLAAWAYHGGAPEALIIARECRARELRPGTLMRLLEVTQAAGPALEAAKANLTLYVRRNIEQYFHLREAAQEAVATYSDGVRKAVSDLTSDVVDNVYRTVGVLAAAIIAGLALPAFSLPVLRLATGLYAIYIAFVLGVVLRARWERFLLEKQALRERLGAMPELSDGERVQIQRPSDESDAYFKRYYWWSFWIYLALGALSALLFLLLLTPLSSALPHR